MTKIYEKPDDEILIEANRTLWVQGIQLVGVIVLIAAGLAKGYAVHIETKIEQATTLQIVAQHQHEDCVRRQALPIESVGCEQKSREANAAELVVKTLRGASPNAQLLAVFGSATASPQLAD